MEIGKKLKNARVKSSFTQEFVAGEIQVSRQTISNWENEKSYPDIVSVIKLSDLYSISLDELLRGDQDMIEHFAESTNIVKSNKKLIAAIISNIFLLVMLIIFSSLVPNHLFFLVGVFSLAIICSSILLYQIIKRI